MSDKGAPTKPEAGKKAANDGTGYWAGMNYDQYLNKRKWNICGAFRACTTSSPNWSPKYDTVTGNLIAPTGV